MFSALHSLSHGGMHHPLQVFIIYSLLSSASLVHEASPMKDSYFVYGYLATSTLFDLSSVDKLCA